MSTNVRFYLSYDIRILENCFFGVKTSIVSLILHSVIMDVLTFPVNR